MAWITGSEADPNPTCASAAGLSGCCHAVDPEHGGAACGMVIRNLCLWSDIPWVRARMAGGELCPACVAETDREHAPV